MLRPARLPLLLISLLSLFLSCADCGATGNTVPVQPLVGENGFSVSWPSEGLSFTYRDTGTGMHLVFNDSPTQNFFDVKVKTTPPEVTVAAKRDMSGFIITQMPEVRSDDNALEASAFEGKLRFSVLSKADDVSEYTLFDWLTGCQYTVTVNTRQGTASAEIKRQ